MIQTETQLQVDTAAIAYGGQTVVEDVSFSLLKGEIGCLLGPSGCGKTSLLRAIAGFEPLAAGEIRLLDQTVSRPGRHVAPERRRVGMVFQDFALFPHLNVERNVAFGLKNFGKRERRQRVGELLELVGLQHLAKARPHQLSGGQQQRIALVRAMAPWPEILLLDEPFSSMDAELREQLAREVRNLLKSDGITAILVTHNQLEAFAMADSIGVMGEGRMHQWDSGYRIYHKPADRFVADFIGQGVMLAGEVAGTAQVITELGRISGALPTGCCSHGNSVQVLLRPDDVVHDDASPLRLKVLDRVFRGAEFLYRLALPGGGDILCLVQSHHNHAVGEEIGIRLDVEELAVFAADGKADSNGRYPIGNKYT